MAEAVICLSSLVTFLVISQPHPDTGSFSNQVCGCVSSVHLGLLPNILLLRFSFLWTHVSAWTCVCVCTCVHTYMSVCTCVCVHMCEYCVCVSMCLTCLCVNVCSCVHVCLCEHVCCWLCLCVCMCVCVCVPSLALACGAHSSHAGVM
jgi:hypothetical protein